MNDRERIQRRIEQQKSLIAKIEANMDQVPYENRNSQMIILQLMKTQLVNLEQIAANQGIY